jgi:hypothetical protein
MPFAPANGTETRRQRKRPRSHKGICRSGTVVARILAATCSAVFVFGGGCGKQPANTQPGIAIEHQITPQPIRVGAATVNLTVRDRGERPVSGAYIALEAEMAHPGMSPEFGEAKEVAPGRYQGSVTFTMAGEWVLLMHITLRNGRRFEQQINVGNVRAN